jgi:hypothetical protein
MADEILYSQLEVFGFNVKGELQVGGV